MMWAGKRLGLMTAIAIAASGCGFAEEKGTVASYEQQLADHLTAQNAKMYGAFWCPHCSEQKSLFGSAANAIPYVECDPEGKNAQPHLCREKNIQGYPTWEINGQLYPGTQPLETLAELSNFQP